jgi:hypothetical protein
MITGAHSIIYSSDAEADMNFFKKILKFPNVDVGHGWLIFGLPPSEIAIHPSAENGLHEFYLMCDDINVFVKEMAEHNIICSAINSQRWGECYSFNFARRGNARRVRAETCPSLTFQGIDNFSLISHGKDRSSLPVCRKSLFYKNG